MLRRQLDAIAKQSRDIAARQKEQTTALQQQNMIMMSQSKPHKRDWVAEIEALDDDEIIQFICEEKPPVSVVTKALKAFALSLDSEIYGD